MWDIIVCVVAAASWLKATYAIVEARILQTLSQHAGALLRAATGLVFVWFGLLKIIGQSPAAALVVRTIGTMHLAHGPVVSALGFLETCIGLGFCLGVALRSTLVLFVLQQAGTFLALVFCPDLTFQQHNPFLLTMTGEFVVKNLVLMTAGIVSVALGANKLRLGSATR